MVNIEEGNGSTIYKSFENYRLKAYLCLEAQITLLSNIAFLKYECIKTQEPGIDTVDSEVSSTDTGEVKGSISR